MASSFTGLGTELMTTGENAGTWGTTTNTNLQIIEQISGGYIEKAVTSTPTTLSVSDGSAGAELAHRVIKFTGTISENTVVTIPLDVQQLYVLVNGTSGAYTVQFKYVSGSGSSVTFATTDKGTKLVYATADDSTNPNIVDTGIASHQINNTITVGVDDTGYDVKFFGATSGKYMLWDESEDSLDVVGDLDVRGAVSVGVDDTGHDVKFFGATSGKYMLWDESADSLLVSGVITGDTIEATADTSSGDNAAIGYTSAEGLILTGQGSTSDVTIKNDADATVLSIATGTGNVGIGATSVLSPLHVASATADADGALGSQSPQMILQGGTGNQNNRFEFGMDNSGGTAIGFLQSRNTSSGVQHLSLNPKGGNVGIGEDSPGTLLDIKGAAGGNHRITFNSSDAGSDGDVLGGFVAENQGDSVGQVTVRRESAGDDGQILFETQATGGSLTERVRIHSGGVMSATQGIALGIGTANTASNVLDDYEEGTFTPTWAGSSATSVASGNYGYYTKIGDVVTVHFGAILTSASTSYYQITNVPFQSNIASGNAVGAGQEYGHTGYMYRAQIPDNSTTVHIVSYTNSVAANAYLQCSLTYRTD